MILKNHLGTAFTILAVFIPVATPSPNIANPEMTPRMVPRISMTTKFMFTRAIKAGIMLKVPPKPSNPATRNDPCLQDTIKAAIASPRAIVPIIAASPACSAPPKAITTRNKTSAVEASQTANTNVEFITRFHFSYRARLFGAHLETAVAAILVVSIPFATPSPIVPSPKMNAIMIPEDALRPNLPILSQQTLCEL